MINMHIGSPPLPFLVVIIMVMGTNDPFNFFSDIDECALNSHNCSENADCTNTQGSHICSCNSGFSGDGYECEGIVLQSMTL